LAPASAAILLTLVLHRYLHRLPTEIPTTFEDVCDLLAM
jgi:hypothetical protein